MSFLRLLGAAGALLLVLASPAAAHKRHHHHHHHHKPMDVKVQLLSINDFHGNLQTSTTGGIRLDPPPVQPAPPAPQLPTSRPAGGAAILGSYVRELERGHRNSLFVAAGDLIGASPLVSALYHDEPTIEAMNLLGLDLSSVGNHEFDEGEAELKRMQRGGCNPTDGCQTGHTFRGANFKYLAANVVRKDNAKTLFRPYAIRRFQGKKIGFIGMTLEGTPSIVSPSGISNLNFLDEAATANRYARELRRKHGVKAIVVLLHEGGTQTPSTFNTNPATYTGCNGFTGPIVDIVNNTTDDVDLFITGHTHQAYDCVIDGRPVTSSSSAGRLLTDIDLTLGRNGDVKDVQTENLPMYSEGRKPVASVDRLVKYYEERSRPVREEPVGRVAEDITNDPEDTDDSREFPLGNLIADAQLAATGGDGDVALMNPGGVRNDLLTGVVTYEEAFNVQPFNNLVVTQTFTGAQLLDVLKDQWCGSAAVNVLLPSSTLTYTFDQSIATSIVNTPCASAANPVSNVKIADVPLDPAASYRVTTNNFLADGGDGFPSLTAGTNRTTLPGFDVDALVAYLAPSETGTPLKAPATDRIDVMP